MYTLQSSEQMRIHTSEQLDDQWRTDYDLLVHPPTDIEEEDVINEQTEIGSLIRRSDMGNHYGGISMEQYEQIKAIPGVKVAAPLAFLGYLEADFGSIYYPIERKDYGFYYMERKAEIFDGIRYRATTDEDDWRNSRYHQYITQEEIREKWNNDWMKLADYYSQGGWSPAGVPPSSTFRGDGYAWSLIAVDPDAEKELLGLDQAMIDGEYLPVQENLLYEKNVALIPFILSNRAYDVRDISTVYRVEVDESLTVEDLFALGGVEYLKTLPKQEIAHLEFNPYSEELLFHHGNLQLEPNGEIRKESYLFSYSDWRDLYRFGELDQQYEGEFDGNPLYRVNPVRKSGEQIFYRTASYDKFNRKVSYDIYGRFDPSQLRSQHTTSKEPKAPDFYNPDSVYITHDTNGKPYEQRIVYQPSPYKNGYYTGGVDAITTLTAAKLFNRDHPISIIRVVVDGVGERTPVSMAKVERIATEIREMTGLQVDVMLGAADRKVQILLDDFEGVPGYGYLLEGWSQSGASFVIEDRVSNTNLLLGLYIFVIGIIGLLLVYRNYVELRCKDLAIQYTFGWTKWEIFRSLILESLFVFIVVGIIFAAARFSIGKEWEDESFWLAIYVISSVAILAVVFLFLFPLLLGLGRQNNLRESGERILHLRAKRPSRSLLGYVWLNIFRYPLRSIIKLLILLCTIIYAILFLGTKGESTTDLMLTFLGERIDLILKPYQWILFALGIGLAFGSYLAIIINQMEKRTREIQLYRAWGWSRARWLNLYIIEELVISSIALLFAILVGIAFTTNEASSTHLDLTTLTLLIMGTIFATLLLLMFTILGRSHENRLGEFM